MEVNWDSRGSLRPTGTLSVVEAEIFQHESAVGPKILSVDEAGVQWMLEHLNFVFDMKPHKLPTPFPARYTLLRKDKRTKHTYHDDCFDADAISVADAISKIEATGIYLGSDENYEWVFDEDQLQALKKQTGKPPQKVK
jgi:hypothetical protein